MQRLGGSCKIVDEQASLVLPCCSASCWSSAAPHRVCNRRCFIQTCCDVLERQHSVPQAAFCAFLPYAYMFPAAQGWAATIQSLLRQILNCIASILSTAALTDLHASPVSSVPTGLRHWPTSTGWLPGSGGPLLLSPPTLPQPMASPCC